MSPSHLCQLIPKPSNSYSAFNSKKLPPIKANHSFFKNTFCPSTIIEYNKLDSNIRTSPSYKLFRKRISEFVRCPPNNSFNVPNSLGLTYISRLRVGLSHFHKHQLHHDFQDSLKPVCKCGSVIEWTKHHFFYCWNCKNERQSLLQSVTIVKLNLLSMNGDALAHLLL